MTRWKARYCERRHPLLHQMLHFAQVIPELALVRTVLHELHTQLHAGDGCLQVVGNRGQQLHALFDVGGDAVLHAVERHRSVGDLGRAGLIQANGLAGEVQIIHRSGQAGQRTDRGAHGQPGTQDQQQQLRQQQHRQPG